MGTHIHYNVNDGHNDYVDGDADDVDCYIRITMMCKLSVFTRLAFGSVGSAFGWMCACEYVCV